MAYPIECAVFFGSARPGPATVEGLVACQWGRPSSVLPLGVTADVAPPYREFHTVETG